VQLIVRTGPLAGGRVVLDPGQILTIGRHDASDLRLDDPTVDRFHARLRVDNDGAVWLEDNGSANGTFVDGRRVTGSERLHGGERIQIGQSSMTVTAREAGRVAMPTAPTASEAPPHAEHPPDAQAPPDSEAPRAPARAASERHALREAVMHANRVAVSAVVIAVAAVAVGGWLVLTARPTDVPDTAALVSDLRPSVVQVVADYGDGFGGGTGWVIDEGAGLIVSNHHVIDGARSILVAGEGMREREAEIVGTAPCEDLAVLRVDRHDDLETLPLGSQGELRQGETVVVLGYPGTAGPGTDLVVTTGVVSVVRTIWTEPALDVRATRTSSRPTPRSTPATRAGRSSTPPDAWSGSTRPESPT
jgi:hypothetical protein